MAGVSVLDLATEVLSLLEVYSPGDNIDPADLSTVLFTMSAICDGWGAEALTIYDQPAYAFTTQPGKQDYTLGPALSNDWVTPLLPAEFTAFATVFGSGANTLEIPGAIYTAAQWNAIAMKSMPSTIFAGMWPQYATPFHTLHFWPMPQTAIAVKLYAQQAIGSFTSTDNIAVFPPGYQEAFTYEAMVKAAKKFGKPITPDMLALWADAKTRVKENNFPILDLLPDPAIAAIGQRARGGVAALDFYLGK